MIDSICLEMQKTYMNNLWYQKILYVYFLFKHLQNYTIHLRFMFLKINYSYSALLTFCMYDSCPYKVR